ncbi:uncharacterized protein LOC134533272 isoform X2 [Bacillus rossius redtenbacheri]|uniref:uncharacterized protein LOC134533272 isoform X2 n=1 Tax=Bacillus rossius redtenbacheri TaxID=93214 RepID=UPI002FDD896B
MLGEGHHLLQRKFEDRFRNLNRGQNHKSIDDDEEEETPKKRPPTKKDTYGCVNFMPKELPANESPQTQEDKRLWLIEEYNKPSSLRDQTKVTEFMMLTYPTQRATIVNRYYKDVYKHWPFLCEREHIEHHFKCLMGFDLFQTAEKSLESLMPLMVKYYSSKVYCDGKKLTQEKKTLRDQIIHIEKHCCNSKEMLVPVIEILIELWKQDKQEVFVTYEETTSSAEVEAAAKQPHPHISILGNSAQCLVTMENFSMIPVMPVYDALLITFALYYVHSVAYPPKSAAVWEFIQRVVFKIDGEGSKVKRIKSSPATVNSRVATLLQSLRQFKETWKI